MGAVVWVTFCIVLCGEWEEHSVPCLVSSVLCVFLISVSLVVGLEYNSLAIRQGLLWDHCWEWFQVWSSVPFIMDEVTSCCQVSEGKTTCSARQDESLSEDFSSVGSGV